jgi:patatin-like phospholipase
MSAPASPWPGRRHVLAVDGGGVRGIVSLWMLDALERRFSVRACDAFDMFAGTSTGAIIAALLAYGRYSARQILELYDRLIGEVFQPTVRSSVVGRLFARRMYSRVSALEELDRLFGDRLVVDLEGPRPQAVLLTTHDMVRNEEIFLSNYSFLTGKPNYGRTWRVRDAVAASALSAPWYFGPYEGRFIDGGTTVFNTPARQAAIEALDYCAAPRFESGQTVVWSLGSGAFESDYRGGDGDGWFPWQWAQRLVHDLHGDAEADQIHGAVRMARRGEIELRRYQITICEETLQDLGVSLTTRLPIALDRADAGLFLNQVGRAFAERIDWDDPKGYLLRPTFADPLQDQALWRSPIPPAAPPPEEPSQRLA